MLTNQYLDNIITEETHRAILKRKNQYSNDAVTEEVSRAISNQREHPKAKFD